jgi:hypothetical protein
VHREHGGRLGDPERAPGHAELALIDRGARVNLDPIVALPHGGLKLKRYAVAGRQELPLYTEVAVVCFADLARDEAHVGVSAGVEEVSPAEVFVTLVIAGVYAGGVDDQLQATGAVVVDLEPAVDAVELALTFTSPQKCGTRNSAREWAGSIIQRVVVLTGISLSSLGGCQTRPVSRRYANRARVASVTVEAAITIQPAAVHAWPPTPMWLARTSQ